MYKVGMSEYHKEYRKKNPEKTRMWTREYSRRNRKKRSEYHKMWYEKNKDSEPLRERMRLNSRKYSKSDKGKMKEKMRRARKLGAYGSHTKKEWDTLKEICNFMCMCCKKKEPVITLTEDHIVPLTKGGSNLISNIQPLCISCNSSKHTKTIKYFNKYNIIFL